MCGGCGCGCKCGRMYIIIRTPKQCSGYIIIYTYLDILYAKLSTATSYSMFCVYIYTQTLYTYS